MDKLLLMKEFDFYGENVREAFESALEGFNDEKALPIIVGASSLLVASSAYFYYNRKYSYWQRRSIEGPPVKPLFGHLLDLVKSPVLTYESWKHKYGTVVGIYLGSKPALIVSDAELLHDILIRNFNCFSDRRVGSGLALSNQNLISQNGSKWKHDRTIMSPTFTSGKMKQMYPLMMDSYKSLEAQFERFATEGSEVALKSVFNKLTTMVIARCAFATHVDPFTDPDNELYKMLKQFFEFTKTRALLRFFLPEWIKKLVGYSSIDPGALKYIGRVCAEVLKQRSQNGSASAEYKDLLQLLMDTNTGTDGNGKPDGFSDIKIVSNAILFFIAGFETTSTLLTWTAYALATNQDIQERLYQEVKEAKERSGDLDYETLFELKYLDAVMKESLRMYPPITRVERIATVDHTLPNGLKVEKGTPIHIPIYTVHHDPNHFVDPETFDPERFMPENKDQLQSCSFIPFVEGPRNCIGARFALLEAKMAIAGLILKYKFVKSARTPEKLVFDKNTIVLEVDNMPIKVQKRTSST